MPFEDAVDKGPEADDPASRIQGFNGKGDGPIVAIGIEI